MFILNPNAGVPLYRQLQDQIRRMIASGLLQPGDTLPSIRDIAIRHAVNPMTVSKAYSLLEAEGLLEHNRGKPMTVAAQTHTRLSRAERLRQLDDPLQDLVLAATQLELKPEEVLQALRKKWETM